MQLTVKHIDDDFETASGTKEYVFHSKYVPGVGDTILLPPEIHSYSPPQFQKRAKARENILLLEERLQHFVEWLDDKGFSVIGDDGEMPVSRERMYLLVMEYVES